jgi:hypothetical protein
VLARVFNVPIEDKQACVFVEPGVIGKLQAMVDDGQRQPSRKNMT